jgi:hypothetical protein
MKQPGLWSAGLLALIFATLAALPLTRSALKADTRLASGSSSLSGTLVELGLKREDLPLGGIGPSISAPPDVSAAPGNELEVQLANATRLVDSKRKWAALQKLVQDFPNRPESHANLLRYACNNAGSVGIGRGEEQDRLSIRQDSLRSNSLPEADPADIALMLNSSAAGEKLDPQNAYFPIMAAVAYFSANRDADALAALHRAGEKKVWHEYTDAEFRGQELRAQRLGDDGSSLSRSVRMATLLFPHYAQLRALARLATVKAMDAEVSGDFKAGLQVRRDVWSLGRAMRVHGTTGICNLVGVAIVQIASSRPGGAPTLKAEQNDEEGNSERNKKSDARFVAFLSAHGFSRDATDWSQERAACEQARTVVAKGAGRGAWSISTMGETMSRLVAGRVLLATLALLCLLAGLAFLVPLLGRRFGWAGITLAVLAFLGTLSYLAWHTLGGVRDMLAYVGLTQSLSGDGANLNDETERVTGVLMREGALAGLSLLLPLLVLFFVGVLGGRPGKPSRVVLLRRWTLPTAAVFALIYAVHLGAFCLRERAVNVELDRLGVHEGRYLAERLGSPWPGATIEGDSNP